jgi:hypothetical protein
LGLQPVKQFETLRCHEQSWSGLALADGATKALAGVAGDACELGIEAEVGAAQRCGLKVRAAAGAGTARFNTVKAWDMIRSNS